MGYRDAFDGLLADHFPVFDNSVARPQTPVEEAAEIAQEVRDAEIDALCEGLAADAIHDAKHYFRHDLDDYLDDNLGALKVAIRLAASGHNIEAADELRKVCSDWQRYFVGVKRDDAIAYMRERGML